MKKIPLKRALIYTLIFGLLPLFGVATLFTIKKRAITEQRFSIQSLREELLLKQAKQSQNQSIIGHYKDADHFYIDKNLESITFLEPEIEKLKEVISNKNYAGAENIKKRHDFLTGPNNRLLFTEGSVQSTPYFQETIETLTHPVEVNLEDLKKILSRCEGVSFGSYQAPPKRPQLIILDCKLDKKMVGENNEVYLLNLKVLKREFL